MPRRRPEDSILRFWAHVDRRGPDECWPWTGALNKHGYGRWASPHWPGSYAHRTAWAMTFGPIPEGMEIDHRCHVDAGCRSGPDCLHRRCCNPSHLRILTTAENRAFRLWPQLEACPNGHSYLVPGARYASGRCRKCQHETMREYRKRPEALAREKARRQKRSAGT